MKKFFSVGFATLGSLILILIIVFSLLQIVINDETYINNEFTKLEINQSIGMSNLDLVRSFNRLVDYMEGKVPDITLQVTVNGTETNMFDLEQEVTHMVDVRTIYQTIRSMRDYGVLLMLILFLFGAVIDFRRSPQILSQGFLSGSFIALLFFGFLGTWAAMDFSSFWTFFHQALFWNELWLFDATESRMINMLPEQMFADIVSRIFTFSAIVVVVLVALAIVCLVVSSEKYQKQKVIRKQRARAREKAKAEREKAKAEAKAAAQKAKRIAAKKKKKAELMQKRKKQAEAQRRIQQKGREKAAQPPVRRVSPEVLLEEPDAIDAEPLPQQEPIPKADTGRRTASKKSARGNIHDDTGFLDD